MTAKDRPIRIWIAHRGSEAPKETRPGFLTQCFDELTRTLEQYDATLIMDARSHLALVARAAVPQDHYDALVGTLSSQNYLIQQIPEI
jgi:hypothetical protein